MKHEMNVVGNWAHPNRVGGRLVIKLQRSAVTTEHHPNKVLVVVISQPLEYNDSILLELSGLR